MTTKKMSGPTVRLVDPESATANRVMKPGELVHPIGRNHSEMVKFARGDSNFGPIIEMLRHLCGLLDTRDISTAGPDKSSHVEPTIVLSSYTKYQDTDDEEKRRLWLQNLKRRMNC